jgi:ribosomal protein S18 acetylase RimI-like enzyme
MVKLDCEMVATISATSTYRDKLTELAVCSLLKNKSVIGLVSELAEVGYEQDPAIVGFAFIRSAELNLEIKNMAVAPVARGLGIASALIEHTERIAESIGHGAVYAVVHERELTAQYLLRRNGYLCERVIKNWSKSDDAYLFTKDL